MNLFNIICGIVTITSFVWAIYGSLKNNKLNDEIRKLQKELNKKQEELKEKIEEISVLQLKNIELKEKHYLVSIKPCFIVEDKDAFTLIVDKIVLNKLLVSLFNVPMSIKIYIKNVGKKGFIKSIQDPTNRYTSIYTFPMKFEEQELKILEFDYDRKKVNKSDRICFNMIYSDIEDNEYKATINGDDEFYYIVNE